MRELWKFNIKINLKILLILLKAIGGLAGVIDYPIASTMRLLFNILYMKRSHSPSSHHNQSNSPNSNKNPNHGGGSFIGEYDNKHEEDKEIEYDFSGNAHSPGSIMLEMSKTPIDKMGIADIIIEGTTSGIKETINAATGDGYITDSGYKALKEDGTAEDALGSGFDI